MSNMTRTQRKASTEKWWGERAARCAATLALAPSVKRNFVVEIVAPRRQRDCVVAVGLRRRRNWAHENGLLLLALVRGVSDIELDGFANPAVALPSER